MCVWMCRTMNEIWTPPNITVTIIVYAFHLCAFGFSLSLFTDVWIKHLYSFSNVSIPHLCFTQSVSRPSAVVQPLWPLRFGGCDRGQPVSVSLRAEQWHLTQYPRRIRFLSHSPSLFRLCLSPLSVSGLRLQRDYYGVTPSSPPSGKLGHPLTPSPTTATSMPHLRARMRNHHVPP